MENKHTFLYQKKRRLTIFFSVEKYEKSIENLS